MDEELLNNYLTKLKVEYTHDNGHLELGQPHNSLGII